MNLSQYPLRLATGAFILNSGIGKLGANEGVQQYLHGAAVKAFPSFFQDMSPADFTKLLSYSEIALGAALVVPTVPATVAGAGLAGFGASLLGLYFSDSDNTEADGIRPSQQGIPLAKDVWLVGAGLTLMLQGIASGTKSAAQAIGDGVRTVNPFVD